MDYKKILQTVPAIQAANLASHNYNFVKEKKKNFPKQAVNNIVGVSMIKMTSTAINDL